MECADSSLCAPGNAVTATSPACHRAAAPTGTETHRGPTARLPPAGGEADGWPGTGEGEARGTLLPPPTTPQQRERAHTQRRAHTHTPVCARVLSSIRRQQAAHTHPRGEGGRVQGPSPQGGEGIGSSPGPGLTLLGLASHRLPGKSCTRGCWECGRGLLSQGLVFVPLCLC